MKRQFYALIEAIPHAFAVGFSLFYAWHISQTMYVKTGLQFIAPLLVIMIVHLFWLILTQGLPRGFSMIVYRRSAQTAIGMAFFILSSNLVAPMPANAAGNEGVSAVLMIVFCVTVVSIVVGVAAFVVYSVIKMCAALINRFRNSDHPGNDSRLFDIGSLTITGIVLCFASLEGLPNTYAFETAQRSVASYVVDASPVHVWQKMEQATSPDFPLPSILSSFPQPVAVVTDEGTKLGATRKVEFQGREGTGFLTLRVVERSDTLAVFEVVSDTSPFANWIAHRRLTYHLKPEGTGTRLTVSLEYDRLLAPAWFFDPAIKGAAYLAVDVLARDVKSRAEG